MITTKQLKIFSAFTRHPFKEMTRQEIKKEAKEKSNNSLSKAFEQFKKENLLVEKKVGKSSLFSLNLDNYDVFQYIALTNNKNLNKIIKQSTTNIIKEVQKSTQFFSIIIFGSHAINEETAKSDLDIAIIIENKTKIKEINTNLKTAKLKSLKNIDSHIITKKDFITMLTNDEENLGKQIAKKHLTIYNHRIFYEIIKEGIENGFKI